MEDAIRTSQPNACAVCGGSGVCPACAGDASVISLVSSDPCPRCQGKGTIGWSVLRRNCTACGGDGLVKEHHQLVECPDCAGTGTCAACAGAETTTTS
jgi:DnaJ-class molecular chaperone